MSYRLETILVSVKSSEPYCISGNYTRGESYRRSGSFTFDRGYALA